MDFPYVSPDYAILLNHRQGQKLTFDIEYDLCRIRRVALVRHRITLLGHLLPSVTYYLTALSVDSADHRHVTVTELLRRCNVAVLYFLEKTSTS